VGRRRPAISGQDSASGGAKVVRGGKAKLMRAKSRKEEGRGELATGAEDSSELSQLW